MDNNKDMLDNFLSRLGNQDLLKVDDEDCFIDAIVDSVSDNKTIGVKKSRGWVIALRVVSSAAAAFFVALFFCLNGDFGVADDDVCASCDNDSNSAQILPCVDADSSPRDIYACYIQQKLADDKWHFLYEHF